MEDAFSIFLGSAFIMLFPAMIIIGFGIAVGLAAAIPVALITSLTLFIGRRPPNHG